MADSQLHNESESRKQPMELVFHREGSFYVVPHPAPPEGKTWEQVAADSAAVNEGTAKIETLLGRVLWEASSD